MEESNRHKTFCNPQCTARKSIVLDLKYLLSVSENIDKTLRDFSSSQDEEFKELPDFPHTSFNESPRFLDINFADISMEEAALNFPLSQDLNNAMLRIISRIQKLKETENQLIRTYKNACNSQDKEEIQRLTVQLREMSQEVEFLSKKIEENEEEREKTGKSECKDCGKNVQKLKEFKGEIEEIKKELIKADELLNTTRKEKADLESAYIDLQKQLEELKDFDPKEYEAAFAGLNSEKEDLIKLNKELARKYNIQESMIWKIEKELENANIEIEEKDRALIIARNMITKLQSSQNELERKLKQQKQLAIQNKLKGQSFADIESHEGMLRSEIYSLHDKIEKISIESDREIKNREEVIRKLNGENNDLKQAFDEIEGKLKEIESENKLREENHQNEMKKLTESLAEKEESIGQLSKLNQEQLKLKDLELTQMKKSINSGISVDNEKPSLDEEKTTLRSTTPIKRKSPVKTYAKMPIKQTLRPSENIKTVSDIESNQQSELAETEKPSIEKPLSMLWREQLQESLKKESLYKKQLGKINEQENQFFKERIKILEELGSTKHQLSEKLRMREEEYESKINEIATKQQNLLKIVEEMQKSLLMKDKQIKEQSNLYLCEISEMKKLIDIFKNEIAYRDDIYRKNYFKPLVFSAKIDALNDENSKLRQNLEDSKRELTIIMNEKEISKGQYKQAEEIINSLKLEIQLAENELLSMPKLNFLTEEKPMKLYEKIKEMKNEFTKSIEWKETDIKTINNLQAKLKEMEDYYEKALSEKAAINQQLIATLNNIKQEKNTKRLDSSQNSALGRSENERSRASMTPLRLSNRSRYQSLDLDAQPFTTRESDETSQLLFEKDKQIEDLLYKLSSAKTHRRRHSHKHKGKFDLSEVLNLVEYLKDEILGNRLTNKDLSEELKEILVNFSEWLRTTPHKLSRNQDLGFYSEIISLLLNSSKLADQIYSLKQLQSQLYQYDQNSISSQLLMYVRILCENNESNPEENSTKVRLRLETLYRNLKSSAESISKVANRLQEMKWSLSHEETRADIFLRVLEMVGNFFENYILEHKNDEETLLKAIKELSNSNTKPLRSSRSMRSYQ
ncbi:unnamed protein product [Blepharisma stoltei]|uniref:Uncharacterized protein n=1 Tax=Blepharisma stoltei TaxID=1481888 RepID=A0AAU9IZ41_9CILI|nr:unnamed protein product [Blepharisma stoltei]